MSLVDANGNPTKPNVDEQFQQQVGRALMVHQQQLQNMAHGMSHLSLLVEFVIAQLEEKDIELNLDGFSEFAERRVAEIQEEAKKLQEEQENPINLEE